MQPSISSGLNSVVLCTITRRGVRPACGVGKDRSSVSSPETSRCAKGKGYRAEPRPHGRRRRRTRARHLGIEDLAAAGDEARPIGLTGAPRKRGRCRRSLRRSRRASRNPAGLGVKRQSNPPHDAGPAAVTSAFLADDLHGQPLRCVAALTWSCRSKSSSGPRRSPAPSSTARR